jgi:hypothetical protein
MSWPALSSMGIALRVDRWVITKPDFWTGWWRISMEAARWASTIARSTACEPKPASPAIDRSSSSVRGPVSSEPSISAARLRMRSASILENTG